MVDLKLENNERIICRVRDAGISDGKMNDTLEGLFLTNLHLISVYEKPFALFSKEKMIVDKKPLNLISIYNGEIQVETVKDDEFEVALHIFYDNGMDYLYSLGEDVPKSVYLQWEDAIKKAVIENSNAIMETNKVSEDFLAVGESKSIASISKEVQKDNSNMFVFCTSCGARNNIRARFCQNCGTPFGINNKPKQTEPQHMEEHQQSTYSERKQEYAGKIIKCPNCGEVLKSFAANCPSCGFELRDTNTTSSVREFTLKLEAIESRRSKCKDKKHSFISKIYGSDGKLTDTDEQKIGLIRSFSVPNTKEDVLEFMILASSNVEVSIYGWGDKGVITESRKAVSEAWIAKMEQVYEKAKLMFANTPEFQNIEKTYLKKVMEVKKRKRGIWVTLIGLNVGLWGLIGLILLITTLMPKPTLEKQIENRQNHLEYVVEQIESDIADGKFADARNKAYTLTFDEALDSERHNYWEQKQQDILEQIEKASGEKAD